MRDALFVFFVVFIVVCHGYNKGPSRCTGPNEELDCVKECPPERTCRKIQFRCADDKKPCTLKCVCKKGYFRNAVGTCITAAQCDRCRKPNEYFACGSACDNECSELDTQNKTNCPIRNIVCNEMCYCEDGFARDSQGNCIPAYKCPKKPVCPNKCGPNEVFASKKSCTDRCMSLDAKFKCNPYEKPVNGCYCKSGFLRSDKDINGKKPPCMPICQCPQMKNHPCRKVPRF